MTQQLTVKNSPLPPEIRHSPELVRDYGMAYIAVQSGLTRIKRVSEALWIFAKGRALGLSPAEALDSYHVIDGKPTMSAQLMLALMKRAGFRCIDKSEPGKYAAIEVSERDEITKEWVVLGTAKFTIENAKDAGLLSKKNWQTYRDDQLWARAVSRAARRYAPQVLCGALYTPEEMGAEVTEDGHVIYEDSVKSEGTAKVDVYTNDPIDAEVVDHDGELDAVVSEGGEVELDHVEEQASTATATPYWKVVDLTPSKTGKDYWDANLVSVETGEKKKYWASNRIVLSVLDKALALNHTLEIMTEKRQIIDCKIV